MRLTKLIALPLAALVLSLSAAPADAQSTREMNQRLERLEREISTLNRSLYGGGQRTPNAINPHARNRNQAQASDSTVPRDFAANFETRLADLEQQIRNLTGRLERQEGAIRALNKDMGRRFDDLTLRLEDAEQKLVAAPLRPAAPPSAPVAAQDQPDQNTAEPASSALAVPAAPQQPAGSPDEVYQTAFKALQAADYASAEGQFRDFVANNPSHDLADNAQYWLAETYYVRGQYDAAAVAFAQAVKKYPEGNKTPDSLLKLGMSLGQLGQPQKACVAFSQLASKSNEIGGTLRRRLGDEQAKYQCR
ncbi:MAG: tol-pal system protein YbgF [Alphaproteobacteria bacterium]